MVETRRCRRRRESPLGWVGLVCTSTTSTDMAPSEGEDGVGWPGLCSLDRGASRRPMIGNQIAAHPSPSSSCRRPILCHGDSLLSPRGSPGHQLSTLTLSPRNPIQSLLWETLCLYLALSILHSVSVFLFNPLFLCTLSLLSLSLSISLSLFYISYT